MDEELLQLLANGQGDATAIASAPEARITDMPEQTAEEIELTPELRRAKPVVNKARRKNRLSGISDFLANPEAQNALLQFGRAFARNQPGEAGTVLADAGEQVIGSNANQSALEAFESGGDIAKAAGRFADPELVANLQARRQQTEQFEEQMDARMKEIGLQEERLKNDTTYQVAKLALDDKLAESTIRTRAQQQEIDQQMADAQQAYWEALAEQSTGEGQGYSESLALRTNEYLQILGQQELVMEDDISNTVSALNDLDVSISDQQLQQLKNGIINISDIDISSADASSIPFYTGNGKAMAQNLLSELGTKVKAVQTTRAQRRALQATQTERLTGQEESEIEQQRRNMLPGGSPDNPLPVATPQQAMEQSVGTFVNYGGVIYEVLEGGKRRRIGPAN